MRGVRKKGRLMLYERKERSHLVCHLSILSKIYKCGNKCNIFVCLSMHCVK